MDKPRRFALLMLLLALFAGAAPAGVLDQLDALAKPEKLAGQRDFLPPDQAFVLTESSAADGRLVLRWDIQPGYYLYRDKFKVTAATPGLVLGEARLAEGETKQDPEFGAVKIFKHAAEVSVPISARPAGGEMLEAEVRYQGCAEDGICYPPIKKKVAFSGEAEGAAPAANGSVAGGDGGQAANSQGDASAARGEQGAADRITAELGHRSLALTLVSFLGLGLLLAFTPCVLPMVPILSGIIIGQQQPVSAMRGFALSSVYVVAMAATYAMAGVAAGLLGHNLQAAFQKPAVLVAFSLLFVALALSMFGFYELQLPAALQTRLDRMSRAQRGGSYVGVGVMGALSALIVGPCVAPPLAGALAYISQTGSALVGGSALFALGLGMGLPLIALGTSAGGLLPRVGAWMENIKRVFGVVFLGVAILFLSRILPGPATLALWALLLIGSAVFLGALDRHAEHASGWKRFNQGLGLASLVYGVTLVIGAAAGGDDPLQPLAPLAGARANAATTAETAFVKVDSLAAVEQQLADARSAGQAVMLDFYADWCIECKHLEKQTFAHSDVAPRLTGLKLLRADVTAGSADDKALLEHYGLFGPPAVLFFTDGQELRNNRVTGFVEASEFNGHLDRLGATRP
ncbi:MAG: protein-disulfide reductase DsbD [Proteobacteria bacterium]|nr:protein-disulfide reductase DsbD [Pseudomonadota bacterium]